MKKDTVVQLRQPEGQDLLSTMLREGAQRLIAEALQAEFDEFLSQFAERRDERGPRGGGAQRLRSRGARC